MDVFAREQGCFCWGGFILDPARRALSHDGVRIRLAERLFDVLLHLVANQGRVVDRDELLRTVWSGRTVDASNVGQAIFELRRALKPGEGAEPSIVTVPGRGFRFAAPVTFEALPVARQAGGPDAPPPRTPSRWGTALPLLVALVSLLVAGISLAVWTGQTKGARAFAPPAHSIAVLAFDNLTGDPGQAYVSDGLSEQLIDALTRVDGVKVAGRTSSFAFRGGHATAGEIGRALDVGAVLAGSLRRAGAQVVVTAQLTDAVSGYTLWSRTFSRDGGDVVGVQTAVARDVVEALRIDLLGDASARLTLGGTTNPSAYDAYLRGTALEHTARDEADHRAALAAFDRAVALDPAFARAHNGRSRALANIAMLGAVGSSAAQHRLFADALAAADRAVALAPDWGQAYSSRAWVLNYGFLDPQAADRAMVRAQALIPGSSAIEGNAANIALATGQLDRAVAAGRRGTQIDPLSVNAWGQFGRILFMARRYDDAAEALHHAAAVGGGLSPLYTGLLGGVLLMQGHAEAAATLCQPATTLEEKEVLAIADHSVGRQAAAETALARLRADQGDAGAFSYAEILAQWGRKADALVWLATAARLHDPGMAEARIDPMLDPIRTEAAFGRIVDGPGSLVTSGNTSQAR